MRILLVEDEPVLGAFIERNLRDCEGVTDVVFVGSRDDALTVLATDSEFDVAVVDLRIPPVEGSFDLRTDYGLLILSELETRHPSILRIAHTALAEPRILKPLYERSRPEHIYGRDPESMFVLSEKTHDDLMPEIRKHLDKRRELARVTFSDPEFQTNNGQADLHIIRAFAASQNATTISARRLTGGKSSAGVFELLIFGHAGKAGAPVAAKIDRWDRVDQEFAAYDQYISGQLANGSYAQIISRWRFLNRGRAGIFYGLAESGSRELSDLYWANDPRSADVVDQLKESQRNIWFSNAVVRKEVFREIRRSMVSDVVVDTLSDELKSIVSILDPIEIVAPFSTQHGDLHAGNVLVSPSGRSVVIDYARAGNFIACLDAVTLELAITFNSNVPTGEANWPTLDRVSLWPEASKYFPVGPRGDMLRRCRQWAVESVERAGSPAIYAAAAAYLIRQCQYADIDVGLATAMLRRLVALLISAP